MNEIQKKKKRERDGQVPYKSTEMYTDGKKRERQVMEKNGE